jgi:predicted amidohydrolase
LPFLGAKSHYFHIASWWNLGLVQFLGQQKWLSVSLPLKDVLKALVHFPIPFFTSLDIEHQTHVSFPIFDLFEIVLDIMLWFDTKHRRLD